MNAFAAQVCVVVQILQIQRLCRGIISLAHTHLQHRCDRCLDFSLCATQVRQHTVINVSQSVG